MRSIPHVLAVAWLALAANAQVQQLVGTPPSPLHTLNFDAPFVASGPIASNASAFTSNGIASVSVIGTWAPGGDSITAGSNGSGQSLVFQSGVMAVAGIGAPLDNCAVGAGFDIRLLAPATDFGVLFIDQINFSYVVELRQGAASLGSGSFPYSGSFPSPAHYWRANGAAFDRILITFSSAIGVGIDNFAISGSAPPPSSYCTAGTSTNGCTPAITASAHPSVSGANACIVSVLGSEGQQSGLIFYGVDNSGFTPLPWGPSTSFMCIKQPQMRTPVQASGGTFGACDGALTLDWNAFQAANPTALGNPWIVGDPVYLQAWYRDPPSPKTTNLSDAVQMAYAP